jgi:hypothetical protein
MAWSTVTSHSLGYSIVDKQSLDFQLENDPSVTQIFVSAEELLALADMFRNKGPVNFNTDGKYFVTGVESSRRGEPVRLPSGTMRPCGRVRPAGRSRQARMAICGRWYFRITRRSTAQTPTELVLGDGEVT